jgi:hypothetical protein
MTADDMTPFGLFGLLDLLPPPPPQLPPLPHCVRREGVGGGQIDWKSINKAFWRELERIDYECVLCVVSVDGCVIK